MISFFRNNALLISTAILLTLAVAVPTIYLTRVKWYAPIEYKPVEVDPAVLWADYTKHPDDYMLIDVRSQYAYDTTHAKGSINDPIGNLFDDQHYLPRSGKKIVLFCSSGRLAGVAYGFLEHQGFLNLLHVEGGLQNWLREGMPVEGTNIHAPLPAQD